MCVTIFFMGIIVNNLQERSELQQRIAAELREKQLKNGQIDPEISAPEFDVEKSEYLKNMESASMPGWIWIVGLVIVAGLALILAIYIKGH